MPEDRRSGTRARSRREHAEVGRADGRGRGRARGKPYDLVDASEAARHDQHPTTIQPNTVDELATGPPSGRATCRASRPRWSRSWPPSSASRCSSRARPASARPSSPRRWRATSAATLVRLQCYEGLDEAKALYEWNYRKQLLRIQTEADDAGWRRRPGRHLRRGVPAPAAADDGDRLRRAGRAADRRDRQDRPGVRGDAARAAVATSRSRSPSSAGSRRARSRSCCSPRTTRAS